MVMAGSGACCRVPAISRSRAAGWLAIAGLSPGFIARRNGFMPVSHGWIAMRVSKQRYGVPDAFRFFVPVLFAYLAIRHDGIGDARPHTDAPVAPGRPAPLAIRTIAGAAAFRL